MRTKVVFLLRYEHKHGDDYSVYTHYKGAEKAAGRIICQYIKEVEENDKKELLELLRQEKYLTAMQRWTEVKGETEFLTIQETVLCTSVEPPKLER
jgi:hypothetical protein